MLGDQDDDQIRGGDVGEELGGLHRLETIGNGNGIGRATVVRVRPTQAEESE